MGTTVPLSHPETLAAESLWSRPNRHLTIGLILIDAGGAFETLAVATTLPRISRELDGLALYGWAFSAFMLANLVGIIITGVEADRQGPARPFGMGLILFMLGLIITGIASTMTVVIVGRAIQGLGAGIISSIVYVAIGRGYSESLRPRMLAVLSTVWIVPGLIGPGVAALIADYFGWRWVFLGLTPLLALAATLALPAMHRLGCEGGALRDWSQITVAVRLVIGVGLIMTGLSMDASLISTGLVGVGIMLGLPALSRLLPQGTLRAAPGLPACIATIGLLNLAFFGVDAFIPLALTAVRGQTATVAGLTLTASAIMGAIGAWLQAHFVSQQGRRVNITLGIALITAAIAGSVAITMPWVSVLLAPIAWGIGGLGWGLAYTTLSLVVLEMGPVGREGNSTSALQVANVLGSALGTGLGGVIIAYTNAANQNLAVGISVQSLLMISVIGIATLTSRRLFGKSQPGP
jgi:MFS family permease